MISRHGKVQYTERGAGGVARATVWAVLAALASVVVVIAGDRAGSAAEPPTVTGVGPVTVEWADTVTIEGRGFGTIIGTITVGGREASAVQRWDDGHIEFQVPSGASPGDQPVWIVTSSGERLATVPIHIHNYLLPRDRLIEPGRLVVQLATGALPAAVSQDLGLTLRPEFPGALDAILGRHFLVDVEAGEEGEQILRLAAHPQVSFAQPNFMGTTSEGDPNDPRYQNDEQWGLGATFAPLGWDYTKGSPASILAVIDTGVDVGHPDLAANHPFGALIFGEDANGNPVASNACGHGTHVAGIAAAATHNSTGIAGMGWTTPFRSYDVFELEDPPGAAPLDCFYDDDDLAAAIVLAANQGVRVINLSLSGANACAANVGAAVQHANSLGVVVIAAAGNDSVNLEPSPSNCGGVVSVAATAANARLADFSNFGNWVDLSAPGVGILSTSVNGGLRCGGAEYANCDGTSMAAPHVAGVAALMYAMEPNRDVAARDRIIGRLVTGAASGTCVTQNNVNRGAGTCGRPLRADAALKFMEYAHISGFETHPCCANGGPAATSWGTHQLDYFITGTDSQLYHRWYISGVGWSPGYENLGQPGGGLLGGGGISSDPAAVAWGTGRIDAFVRGSNGAMWQRTYEGGWQSWISRGKPLTGLRSGLAAASWGPGRLDVFGVDDLGAVQWRTFAGGAWQGWKSIGSPTPGASGDPAAVSWGTNRIDVFIRGNNDGRLWHNWTTDGTTFHGWEALGGAGNVIQASPDVASWAPNRLDVFVRGTDNRLYRMWWDGWNWSHFDDLGGTLTAGPGAVDWGNGRWDVFVRGTGNSIYHQWRVP